MRRVVTGVGLEGRSTVISDGHAPVAFAPAAAGGGVSGLARVEDPGEFPRGAGACVHQLWSLPAEPALTNQDPTLELQAFIDHIAPSTTKWIITQFEPGFGAPMHATPDDRLRPGRRGRHRTRARGRVPASLRG